jgi:hypothetical protein
LAADIQIARHCEIPNLTRAITEKTRMKIETIFVQLKFAIVIQPGLWDRSTIHLGLLAEA